MKKDQYSNFSVARVDNGYLLKFHENYTELRDRYDRKGNPTGEKYEASCYNYRTEVYTDQKDLAKRLVKLLSVAQVEVE